MKELREELHKLIDEISDESLDKVKRALEKIRFDSLIPSVELTDEEKARLKQAEEEYERGEFYTFEEVFGISQEQAYKEFILEKERVQ